MLTPSPIAIALLNDVAQMNANPIDDAALLGHAGVALDHRVLHLDRAAHGVDHAAEFDDRAVASALHKCQSRSPYFDGRTAHVRIPSVPSTKGKVAFGSRHKVAALQPAARGASGAAGDNLRSQ
jgi:hypothetical protein